MERGRVRPEVGVRGVKGRGKIDGDGIAGQRSANNGVCWKKFRNCEARKPQQMPRSPRAIIFANDFNSHSVGRRES